MKIQGTWIEDAATQVVCDALTSQGFQALFVGGCVRNALLGVDVSDIDIATDWTPNYCALYPSDAAHLAHSLQFGRRRITTDTHRP